MSSILRFAPSPTGLLHVGNTRTALANWLVARQLGGAFILRIDDTDRERSTAEYEQGIREEMTWLGLNWDKTFKQSERFDRYELAKEQLIKSGRLYPCYETAEELDVKRKMLASRGLPPIYDRSALKLTDVEKQAFEAQGRKPHWRFLLEHAPIEWDDLVRGAVKFDGAKIADPVLIREDGVPLFAFSTSVDDGEEGITHILRGEDHVSNTAVQKQIMEALGHKVPQFGHMALLKMKEGKISKRAGGGDVKGLREMGVFPIAVNSYLATIGTSDPIALAEDLAALIKQFGLNKLGRAMANYDIEELARLNEKLLHQMSFAEVKPQLDTLGLSEIDAHFWEEVKANLSTLSDIRDWWTMLKTPLKPVEGDRAFGEQAAQLLPEGEWSTASWDEFVGKVKEATGRKGKELFMPLRLALTGREDGPELKALFALLGRERARKRLLGEVA